MSVAGELAGQTVLIIGGSSGIGLETARQARAQGADLILTARESGRLHRIGLELNASIAAFDSTDFQRLERFFDEISDPIDHVCFTGPVPCPGDVEAETGGSGSNDVRAHRELLSHVARHAAASLRPDGSALLLAPAEARRSSLASPSGHELSTLVRDLAIEHRPVRVNLIAIGHVERSSAARTLREVVDERHDHSKAIVPSGRVVETIDVASLFVHLMINGAVSGATFDFDGEPQPPGGASLPASWGNRVHPVVAAQLEVSLIPRRN